MEFNHKQIQTILKALQIASDVTKIHFAQQAVAARISSPESEIKEKFLSQQVITVDAADEFDSLIPDLKELANRQNYSLNQE